MTRWHEQMSRTVQGGTGSQAVHEWVCPGDARWPPRRVDGLLLLCRHARDSSPFEFNEFKERAEVRQIEVL